MASKTVLYVDDESDQREFVTVILEMAGYTVKTAPDVTVAMHIISDEFPNLVITDIMMPGESGYSLCSKLRSDPATAHIPIIVLTVLDDEQKALEAGATAFLSKPIDAESLKLTVAGFLSSTDVKQMFDRGLEQLRQRKIPEAKATLFETVRLEPDSSLAKWARYYLAQIEQHDHNTVRAIQVYTAILEQDPQFWRAHNRLGILYQVQEDKVTALKHFKASLAINAHQPDIEERMAALWR